MMMEGIQDRPSGVSPPPAEVSYAQREKTMSQSVARWQNALKEIARILPARAHSILNTPDFDRIQSRLRTPPAAQ
jgi:hypothetical protein